MSKKLSRSCQEGNTAPPGPENEIIKHSTREAHFQSKNWIATIYNEAEPTFNEATMDFLAYGAEVCPTTGRKHWQTFVCFKEKVQSRVKVQKALADGVKFYCNPMRGTLAQNEAYCSKEGSYTTHGTLPVQGRRNDIKERVESILTGKRSADDILVDDPEAYQRMSKTLIRAEQIRMSRQYRTEMTKGLWIVGGTGTGKSHYAYMMSGYSMEDIYTHQCGDGWWDFYRQQPCVVLNDFRGNIPYAEMLQMVDKWPYTVNRRYIGPIPFTSRLVIVTSPMTPQEVYKGVLQRNDSIDQLLRRFEVKTIEELMASDDRPSA